jgi:hypothetical protein
MIVTWSRPWLRCQTHVRYPLLAEFETDWKPTQ